MERTTVRELHLNTSALLKNVAEGETYIVQYRGRPIAELRPVSEEERRGKPLPNRDRFVRTLPRTNDIGRILEEDRT
jgi:antitoxin (DNA-binding transcriptional repressor) of toxin-antitoxin stability system